MGLRVLREATQCSLTAKDDRMSLLLFLTHYIRYYGIKPQMTCVSSYCDNESLLKTEEAFHTGKWTRQVGT
jgi:hypothetical protein